MMADKNKQKQIEPSLLPDVFDRLPVGVLMVNEDLDPGYHNPAMSRILGLMSDAALDDLLSHIDPQDHDVIKSHLQEAVESPSANGEWVPLTVLDVNEQPKPVMLKVVPHYSESRYSIQLVFISTEGKGFQESLLSLKEGLEKNKYLTIFESATIGVGILDLEGHFLEVNQTLSRMLGVDKKFIIRHQYADVIPDENSIIETAILAVIEGDASFLKRKLIFNHRDGDKRVFNLTLSQVDDLNALMLLLEDVTERENTHQALIQTEKLSLTGRLAASLAHEINNPLQTSIGCLGLAEEMLDEDQTDLKVYLQLAMDELRRSARIVKRLRDLNRTIEMEEKEWVPLREVMEDVLILTKSKLQDRGIIPVFPKEDLPISVFGSRDQLQQVLLNIVINAIDVMPHGGTIYIDVMAIERPEGIQLKIRDTGPGMEQHIREKLFDPFFTTKEEGLGLGLFICRRIVEDHQGKIRVNSQPGNGTEFIIWFPTHSAIEQKEA
jgi:PAS domain S-box-containing protein